MRAPGNTTGEFTGRHMLIIMLAFFGVIIVVNVVMATLASTSWTGLVVENSYVASQEFNTKAAQGRAQAALSWKSRLTIAGGEIRYRLTDAGGKMVRLAGVTVQLRRPAYAAEDRSLVLVPSKGDEFATPATLRDGLWIIEIGADARLERPYREVRRIVITDGELR